MIADTDPMLMLHLPDDPKDAAFLKKETARVHAGAVFWYLEQSGLSAGQQLEILKYMRDCIKNS